MRLAELAAVDQPGLTPDDARSWKEFLPGGRPHDRPPPHRAAPARRGGGPSRDGARRPQGPGTGRSPTRALPRCSAPAGAGTNLPRSSRAASRASRAALTATAPGCARASASPQPAARRGARGGGHEAEGIGVGGGSALRDSRTACVAPMGGRRLAVAGQGHARVRPHQLSRLSRSMLALRVWARR